MVFNISYLSYIWFCFWDIWVQFILGVCLCSSDLHWSIWCCTSTKKLSSSVSIRSTKMGKRKGSSSPFHTLFVSFLQFHIHKFCLMLSIFLFRILFLCSLPNSPHFLSICMFLSRNPKSQTNFASSEIEKNPPFLSRNNSISYNLTHFATNKISKNAFFFFFFIEQILILGLPQEKRL